MSIFTFSTPDHESTAIFSPASTGSNKELGSLLNQKCVSVHVSKLTLTMKSSQSHKDRIRGVVDNEPKRGDEMKGAMPERTKGGGLTAPRI